MSIGADRGEVARVNATFGDFADAHDLPAAVRRSMNVVLDELLTNTVSYGLAEREGGTSTIDVDLQPDRLTVTLTDNGTPFDPFGRAVPDTGLSVEERQIGGLGIHLVRQLVDDVSYHRRGDSNVVVLVKLLSVGVAEGHHGDAGGGRSMEITTRMEGDVTIVAIAGSLDSMTSPEAQQALDAILAGGGKKIAVDFTALDYISSAGLRVLLGLAKQLRATGGALRTFGLNATAREVFDISGFSTILPVFPGEAEARKGF
ncbi:MAG: anti-sigma factor antagonist [Gemmatimonadaceae bacterium]